MHDELSKAARPAVSVADEARDSDALEHRGGPRARRLLELIGAALRDRDARVVGTLDSFEALEIGRRLRLDLLVTSREQSDVARDLRTLQPGLRTLVLDNTPRWLDEIEDAVVTALAGRRRGG